MRATSAPAATLTILRGGEDPAETGAKRFAPDELDAALLLPVDGVIAIGGEMIRSPVLLVAGPFETIEETVAVADG